MRPSNVVLRSGTPIVQLLYGKVNKSAHYRRPELLFTIKMRFTSVTSNAIAEFSSSTRFVFKKSTRINRRQRIYRWNWDYGTSGTPDITEAWFLWRDTAIRRALSNLYNTQTFHSIIELIKVILYYDATAIVSLTSVCSDPSMAKCNRMYRVGFCEA